ncbi:ExbD/TolR family protein [Alteraurantiacibacter aquimixticola]|nr:biopolymer transporter ExbD [Alteraurantiacibacter aquimixticola]
MTRAFRRPYPAYRVNAYQASADKPMSEMNTTPLIDVLLVLLIMIIMTIPIAAHNLEVDLPGPGSKGGADSPQIALTMNASGQAFWNGEAVTREELGAKLSAAAKQENEPVIRFQPHALTSYNDAVQVINLADDAGTGKFAFVGNEQYRHFSRD